MKHCTALFAAVLMTARCYSQIKQPVRIESGLVSGVPGRDPSITAFKGIPYAEPPVGNLRWAEPRAPRHWEGIRGADHSATVASRTSPKVIFPRAKIASI